MYKRLLSCSNPERSHMKLFDANACFGIDIVNHEVINHEGFVILEKVELAETAAKLIEYMDYFSIDKAVVWHCAMYQLDPIAGNTMLVEELAGHRDRLIPSLTILPSITDQEYQSELFLEYMRKEDVKILRAFPEQNRYLLNKVTMGEQLQLYSDLKIPIYLEPRNGFEAIYRVLEEFPKLTVILSNIGCWPSARYIFPLLNRYLNVYFETGDFGMLRGYERVCSQFGSERLLFGTNFPTNNMGCSLNCLLTANISSEAKDNIAHKNMERLISEVKI